MNIEENLKENLSLSARTNYIIRYPLDSGSILPYITKRLTRMYNDNLKGKEIPFNIEKLFMIPATQGFLHYPVMYTVFDKKQDLVSLHKLVKKLIDVSERRKRIIGGLEYEFYNVLQGEEQTSRKIFIYNIVFYFDSSIENNTKNKALIEDILYLCDVSWKVGITVIINDTLGTTNSIVNVLSKESSFSSFKVLEDGIVSSNDAVAKLRSML